MDSKSIATCEAPSVLRIIEIAAAGGHNLLIVASPAFPTPGMARRLANALPRMSDDEERDVAHVHELAGLALEAHARPLRAPHHAISGVALAGGARPGEVSLAHHGVLLLDYLAEFRRTAILRLNLALEQGTIWPHRASEGFPARDVILAASAAPCTCTHYGDGTGYCKCTDDELRAYRTAVRSNPLFSRFDLRCVFRPGEKFVLPPESRVSNFALRHSVATVRGIQRERARRNTLAPLYPSVEGNELIEATREEYRLPRAEVRPILRVARTIADLAGETVVLRAHVAEAIKFRSLAWCYGERSS